jgi:hypothetical protein
VFLHLCAWLVSAGAAHLGEKPKDDVAVAPNVSLSGKQLLALKPRFAFFQIAPGFLYGPDFL